MKNFKWTNDKIELLKKYYPNTEWEELYKILGTNKKSSILTMASKYNISRDLYNQCHRTSEQLEFILANYNKLTASEIGRQIKKPAAFVCRILKEHDLKPLNKGLKEEDIEYFKELYPKYTNKYLSEKFFPYLSAKRVRDQAERFGLVKSKEKSIKWYDKEDLLDKLLNVVKKNGRVPLLREFSENGLPSEATFRRYFGSVNTAFELIGIERPYYNNFNFIEHDLNGGLCFSYSEKQISDFLICNNISFEKETLYSTVIPKEEYGKKRFDWNIVGENKYIEYFGLMHLQHYKESAEEKIRLCKKYSINLLSLFPEDFTQDQWKNKILEFTK